MHFLAFLAAAAVHSQAPLPVLWLAPTGEVLVQGKAVQPRITEGAWRVRLSGGYAYNFNGVHGGVLLPDYSGLRLTGSMTMSLWLNLRSYVNSGPGAQILFRGDDRCGLDPYDLVIHSDGTIWFAVQDEQDHGYGVAGEIPLNRWTHVVATFDASTGQLKLWLNDELVAFGKTTRRPFQVLDNSYAPGIGIGNVQNDHGPHNQPLNGMIADLRLYDRVVEPGVTEELAPLWDSPPQE
ncbi:MAG TPA: LamG domain-containing protein [Fimbriimonadaceae bacterium]|nr:LamG domain-containing protein [Fimbriimonadaceae bacterium]